MTPRPVGRNAVLRVLYRVGRGVGWRYYAIVARGIADAANDDPIFPREPSGCEATACLLVALAWEATRLLPYAGIAPDGRRGLYRLRTPMNVDDGRVVTDPWKASHVAVDLTRESLRRCQALPLEHRLSWLLELGDRPGMPPAAMVHPHPESLHRSEQIMAHGRLLWTAHFATFDDRQATNAGPLVHDGAIIDAERTDEAYAPVPATMSLVRC